MDIKEMHIALDQELNKVNSNLNDILLPEEKDFALNKNILRFVRQRYGKNSNLKGEGFEMSQKRYEDLRSLVVPNFSQELVLVPTDDIDYPSKTYCQFAADHAILLNSRTSIVSNECNPYTFQLGDGVAYSYTVLPIRSFLNSGSFNWNTSQLGFYDGTNYNTFIGKTARPGMENYSPTLDVSLITQFTRDYAMRLWSDRLGTNRQPKFQMYNESFMDIYQSGSLIAVWKNVPAEGIIAHTFTYQFVPSGTYVGMASLSSLTAGVLVPGQIVRFTASGQTVIFAVTVATVISGTTYYAGIVKSGPAPASESITSVTRHQTFYSFNTAYTATTFPATLYSKEAAVYESYEVVVNEEAGEQQPTPTSTLNHLAQQDDITTALDNPWTATGPDLVLVTISEDQLEVYQNVNKFIVKKAWMNYLRLPILVSYYMNVSCDLPEFTHDEIVSMTASYLLEEFESGRYQSHKETVATNE